MAHQQSADFNPNRDPELNVMTFDRQAPAELVSQLVLLET